MILEIGGIFILAFAVGYLAATIPAKIKKRRAAALKREQAATALNPEKSKAERLN